MSTGRKDETNKPEELEVDDVMLSEDEAEEDVNFQNNPIDDTVELDAIRSQRNFAEEDDFSSDAAETPSASSEGSQGHTRSSKGGHSSDRNRRVDSAAELFEDDIFQRAQRDQAKLRPYLTGKVVFDIEDKKAKWIFDWSSDKLRVSKYDKEESDCVIQISEENLLKIAWGSLNPQLAMLSDKVKVSGKLSLAIYIFNLIAPRNFLH